MVICDILFGLGFVAMEIYEFHELISEGYGPDRSGFPVRFFHPGWQHTVPNVSSRSYLDHHAIIQTSRRGLDRSE